VTAPRTFAEFMRETLDGRPWVISGARGRALQRLMVGQYEGHTILTPAQYRKFRAAHDQETAERLGTDPLAVIRAFLGVYAPAKSRDGSPARLAPDEGYWLALERTAAALEAQGTTARDLLQECLGAMDSADHQIGQMSGMFGDEDGTIAEAVKALDDAGARVRAFLAGEPIPPHVWDAEEGDDDADA
jgi:hypothetical protein